MEIEQLVKQAVDGDKTALEGITAAIQDNIYYLSLRMLANPDDAKEATQDILIKIITSLSAFRFDSKFTTWVYRVAANHLISAKKMINKVPDLNFELFKTDLEQDLQEPTNLRDKPDYQVLLNELRVSCTMAMLLCLNPTHRMAYILGDILEIEHDEASIALAISKDNFRKQLSRARTKVTLFTAESCGLVSSNAKCSCEKKLTGAIKRKRINSENIIFTNRDNNYSEVKSALKQTQQQLKTLKLQTSVNHYKSPTQLSDIIASLVSEGIKTDLNLRLS
jgi:RNA polymerase sigma factor (sigma-70 family)